MINFMLQSCITYVIHNRTVPTYIYIMCHVYRTALSNENDIRWVLKCFTSNFNFGQKKTNHQFFWVYWSANDSRGVCRILAIRGGGQFQIHLTLYYYKQQNKFVPQAIFYFKLTLLRSRTDIKMSWINLVRRLNYLSL